MTFFEWLGVLGIPSIFSLTVWCLNKSRGLAKQIGILMKAQQAQMRTQLLQQYHLYIDQGWISEDDLEDWENQYQSYHALGQNGILDARRTALFALPNKPN